ncbi:hypothetical protein NQ318_016483 [Aromia moschata]|uniref:Uncharacterized protein n=1 Tax=Aromia moschata TaxID=1265417 RepID=A0AAV8Z4B3_9CUCU|nr:hypothetical protein NQ318_016483 [Aromia moschata]
MLSSKRFFLLMRLGSIFRATLTFILKLHYTHNKLECGQM